MRTIRIFLCLLLSWLFTMPALAAESGHASLRVYSIPHGQNTKAVGKDSPPQLRVVAAITVVPPDNSYFYGPQSKQGLPTSVKANATASANTTAKVQLFRPAPVPKKATAHAATLLAGVDDSSEAIYPTATTFLAEITVPPAGGTAQLSVSGLFCSAASCSPFTYTFPSLEITPQLSFPPVQQAPWFEAWQKGQPAPLGLKDPSPALYVRPEPVIGATNNAGLNAFFGNDTESDTQNSQYVLGAHLEPRFHLAALEVTGVWQALLFGLAAGLILNLMPCVLPVISLKFSALLAVTTMQNKKQQAKAFRIHSLLFALGILTWFGFLAIMLGTAGWVWGEMFQNPVAVAIMGLILFLLGLGMFDVYTLPIFNLKVAEKGNPHWQAFASGLFATLLATPCSGPLMGGVLGWAIRQPTGVLITTIFSVGVGMALPYLAMVCSPRLINLLPKPGAWTIRLEQLVGFMLMAAVAYFMMMLPPEWHSGYLIILVSIAFAAWLWGQIGSLHASTLRRVIARTTAVLVLGGSIYAAQGTLHKDMEWEPFSVALLTEILGKEPIMLEFTADWCPNCKVLEHTTLQKEYMNRLRERYKMRTIRVDLTRFDEQGFALLEELGSKSLPFIALFPAGENAHKPVVLRDIVTTRQLKDAMKTAFDK